MSLALELLMIRTMTPLTVLVCGGELWYMKMQALKLILNILTPGLPLDKGDVTKLQELVSKTYWPFDNIEQWMLAKALTFPSPLSNKMIRNIAVERYCPWITVGKGFKSVRDFHKRLDQLPAKGGEWQQSYITPGPTVPQWSPPMVPFSYRDSLEVLKDIVGDVRLAKDMKWAPERLVNGDQERLYSELWTGDWWLRIQVCLQSRLQSNFRHILMNGSMQIWCKRQLRNPRLSSPLF